MLMDKAVIASTPEPFTGADTSKYPDPPMDPILGVNVRSYWTVAAHVVEGNCAAKTAIIAPATKRNIPKFLQSVITMYIVICHSALSIGMALELWRSSSANAHPTLPACGFTKRLLTSLDTTNQRCGNRLGGWLFPHSQCHTRHAAHHHFTRESCVLE
jgi:hypothetical protein